MSMQVNFVMFKSKYKIVFTLANQFLVYGDNWVTAAKFNVLKTINNCFHLFDILG